MSAQPNHDYQYQNPNQAQQPHQYVPVPQQSSGNDRNAAVLAHILGPIAALVSGGTLAMVAPLVAHLIFRQNSPVAAKHAADAFNFQFIMWLSAIIGGLLTITIIGAVVGILLMVICTLLSIIFGIIAAVKTSNGEEYRYPFAWKILK